MIMFASPMTWRVYDLPHPDPVAENLTYEEMTRFEQLGFHVEPMNVPTPGSPDDGGFDRANEQLKAEYKRQRDARLRAARLRLRKRQSKRTRGK